MPATASAAVTTGQRLSIADALGQRQQQRRLRTKLHAKRAGRKQGGCLRGEIARKPCCKGPSCDEIVDEVLHSLCHKLTVDSSDSRTSEGRGGSGRAGKLELGEARRSDVSNSSHRVAGEDGSSKPVRCWHRRQRVSVGRRDERNERDHLVTRQYVH
jgi:hypothetical protein